MKVKIDKHHEGNPSLIDGVIVFKDIYQVVAHIVNPIEVHWHDQETGNYDEDGNIRQSEFIGDYTRTLSCDLGFLAYGDEESKKRLEKSLPGMVVHISPPLMYMRRSINLIKRSGKPAGGLLEAEDKWREFDSI
jgi:hypothetical protein